MKRTFEFYYQRKKEQKQKKRKAKQSVSLKSFLKEKGGEKLQKLLRLKERKGGESGRLGSCRPRKSSNLCTVMDGWSHPSLLLFCKSYVYLWLSMYFVRLFVLLSFRVHHVFSSLSLLLCIFLFFSLFFFFLAVFHKHLILFLVGDIKKRNYKLRFVLNYFIIL